jgi:hypothetical protein
MKDKALRSTLVVLLLVMVALLGTYVATRSPQRHAPSRELLEQSVVTAPPLGTVMGGPPAAGHATR